MDNLPFREESIDLIWAEGSAFIMGFQEALQYWKRFLKPHGYMAFSDCVWFTGTPTDECREYFREKYPAMMHEQDVTTLIGEAGYRVLGTLRLPDAAWWDHYYTPLSRKLEILSQQYKDDQEVQALLDSFVQEIQIFRDHSREYGYSFFIIRKEDESDIHYAMEGIQKGREAGRTFSSIRVWSYPMMLIRLQGWFGDVKKRL